MQKMPSLNDVFLSVMASFIGFGLVIGIAQAAFDFGGGRSLLLSSPVFAQVLGGVATTAGNILPLEPCPAGQVFYAEGLGDLDRGCRAGFCPTGYTSTPYPSSAAGTVTLYQCIKNDVSDLATTTPPVSSVCPVGYEKTPALWTDSIRKACSLAAQQLKLLDAQCIASAVEKRDNAILAGMDSSYATQRNLVVVRERDLKNAWLQISDRRARRAEIARVWNKYRKDIKYMSRQSRTLKNNSWKQFTNNRKACGVYAASDDYTSVGTDSSLQMFAPTL